MWPKSRKLVLVSAFLLSAAALSLDVVRAPGEQWTAQFGIAMIRGYQQWVRPHTSGVVQCRLHPTCSEFGIQALRQKGLPGVVDIGERLVMCEYARAAEEKAPRRAAVQTHTGGAPLAALALQSRGSDEAAGALACGTFILFFVMMFALGIAILVWVARDAKNRGVDNPILWMLLVFFTNLLGLLIYILVRPAGNLVGCEQCRGKKLQHARVCPHCGNADARVQPMPAG